MTDDWRILVVDDETDTQELVEGLLAYQGITCTAVPTAETALDELEQFDPTLILIDLALPGMDGWGLLHHLMNDPRWNAIPRVAMTAYHTVELAEKAVQEGFDAYFAKPLDAATFVHDLRRIIEN
jgi:CheY-like chemotaxis protein